MSTKANPFLCFPTKLAVACKSSSGEPVLLPVSFLTTEEAVKNGAHYDKAIELVEKHGYEGPFVCFDDKDDPGLVEFAKTRPDKED